MPSLTLGQEQPSKLNFPQLHRSGNNPAQLLPGTASGMWARLGQTGDGPDPGNMLFREWQLLPLGSRVWVSAFVPAQLPWSQPGQAQPGKAWTSGLRMDLGLAAVGLLQELNSEGTKPQEGPIHEPDAFWGLHNTFTSFSALSGNASSA